jgi:putative hemolysin
MNKPVLDPQFKHYLSKQPGLSYVKDKDGKMRRALINSLELALGRRKLERIYHDLKRPEFDLATFFKNAVERSDLQVRYHGRRPHELNIKGPLIFLANHPFGIVDGLLFCELAIRARGDFRIMINSDLCQDEELAPYFLPVDFEPNKQAIKTNIRSKQLALECLSNNIPLLIFPSGMVSTAKKLGFGKVQDGEWTTFAAKLVRESQATVLPIFFHGRNSRKFHIMSHIAEPFRMGLLLHEALNKFGRELDVSIGEPLFWSEKLESMDRKQLTQHLYQIVNLNSPQLR